MSRLFGHLIALTATVSALVFEIANIEPLVNARPTLADVYGAWLCDSVRSKFKDLRGTHDAFGAKNSFADGAIPLVAAS
jgi:hypothetical protein